MPPRAITSEASSYAFLAEVLSRVGRSDDALRAAEQTLRLQTSGPLDSHLSSIGTAYYLAGQLVEAIAPLKRFLSHYPNFLGAHLTLAAVYSELGREAEARAEAARSSADQSSVLAGGSQAESSH